MNKYDAEKAFTMSLSGSTVMFLYLQLYALAKWYFFFAVKIQCAENSDCLLSDFVSGIGEF